LKDRKKIPWPTKDAMSQVYELDLWGSNDSKFYSGTGSHDLAIVKPYISVINEFLKRFETPLMACDLGCGDFNVGKQLLENCKYYYAIDIVNDLIENNKKHFKYDNLEFNCLDISKDNLPKADVVFVRQVLQHLSNEEVQQTLLKLKDYKYVIITEHIPEDIFLPNIDIISGQGTRLKHDSGLILTESPFNFKSIDQKELLSISLKPKKGRIVTTLYKMFY
jgi:SAM-dependent methyltransferase